MNLGKSCIVLLALTFAGNSSAAEAHPLFRNQEVLKAVLTVPISQAYAQRHQEVRLYLPGQWSYLDGNGETYRLDVSIRTRGHFRREFCELPPLQLNFKKKQVRGTLFTGQNKLKLVAPCKTKPKHQQYVVLEYLAYKTLEIITERSFKTRLMRLTYVDSDDKKETWTDLAFVIEDDSDLAKRLGLERLYLPEVRYADLDHPQAAIVQLFQLLIANNDFSVIRGSRDEDCCHNVQLLGEKGATTGRIPIPFDFDMSGLVNADYATPPDQVPVRDVRVRYFNGLCQPGHILDEAISHVQSRREEILSLYRNSAELDDKTKANTVTYVEDFFAILDDPQRVEHEIVGRCRGDFLMKRMIAESAVSTAAPKDST